MVIRRAFFALTSFSMFGHASAAEEPIFGEQNGRRKHGEFFNYRGDLPGSWVINFTNAVDLRASLGARSDLDLIGSE